ncbi:MAG: putative phosphotransacetylase [Clostridiales bacterium]|jgi:putative phosphotransacetylase|nr:putative phosphotransacetylase [Clostridiales bacterium]MDK2933682.1 putative phosphotransacetylase [Clostridiales bacterium]
MSISEAVLRDTIEQIIRQQLQERYVVSNQQDSGIPVGISARHVHLSRADLDELFGKGYELHIKKELMGGQYAAEECVTLVGTNLRVIENVRILGPVRSKTQVEISKTDAIRLGVNAPIRESGNVAGSAPITIVGPRGALFLKEGCIIAKRHIHMSPADAKKYNVSDNDIVAVKLPGIREGILKNVQVRVDDSFQLQMHIDTDEANAMGVKCNQKVELLK